MADFDFNESSRARDDVASGAFTDDYIPLDDFTPPNATGGFAETSFNTQNVDAYGRPIDAYGRPIDTLYDNSTRDGSAFDTSADVHISSGTSIDTLPDPPRITPSTRPGDNIMNLRDEITAADRAAAKTALVNEYYQSIAKNYGLPLPEKIPYDQFEVGRDGKTLYWTPEEGKVISVINTRGGGFLALSTLASKYGNGRTEAICESMGLKKYDSKTRKTGKLSPKCEEAVQHAYDITPDEDVDITPVVADHTIASVEIATEALDEKLTPEQSAALGTIDDPPLDLQWVTPARMKLRELSSEMTRMRDSLVNNEAKLTELDKHIALEERKLEEAPDETTKDRIAERLRKLQDERAARRENASKNREALRSQISRIRETLHRILHEDKTLAERIKTLFREQGIMVVSILTALGMIISTIVLALPGGSGGGAAPPQPPQLPGKGGIKEWLKKHLQSLGRMLAKLAGKAAAALPGIIGSIVSWILSLLGKTAVWLAGNLWAVLLAVGGLLLVAAREWLLPKKPKKS